MYYWSNNRWKGWICNFFLKFGTKIFCCLFGCLELSVQRFLNLVCNKIFWDVFKLFRLGIEAGLTIPAYQIFVAIFKSERFPRSFDFMVNLVLVIVQLMAVNKEACFNESICNCFLLLIHWIKINAIIIF